MQDFSDIPPDPTDLGLQNRHRKHSRSRSLTPWILSLLALGAGIITVLLYTPFGQRVGRGVARRYFPDDRKPQIVTRDNVVVKETIVEQRVEVPVVQLPPALPSGPSPEFRGDFKTMFSGIRVKTELVPSIGDTATQERARPEAYTAEVTVRIRMPKPASTMGQLRSLNPQIGNVLPELETMVKAGKVSGLFDYLYGLKKKDLSDRLDRLDRALTRHNFFDLDTILELQHPTSGRKVLLMQADMDVVSDGSDGDRMPSFDDYILKSSHFQPSTSYGWAKTTDKPNPVVPKLEAELAEARAKLKSGGLSQSDKSSLQSRISDLPSIIADLKRRSYLIGQEDPFVVIPLSFRTWKGPKSWTPQIGDYAVILHNKKLMPAVVGDYGPTVKVGEASLRIAREIDATASPYKRPVNDLQVTYLFFPGTADEVRKAPDYAAWRTRCESLLKEIGGTGPSTPLLTWVDRLAPPSPVPEIPVSPDPAVTNDPSVEASPGPADAAPEPSSDP